MDLGAGIRKALTKITGASVVDEQAVKELVKELQRALLQSDVNVKLVFELSRKIEKRCLEERPEKMLSLREHVVKVVYEELAKMLGEKYAVKIGKQKIMLCGLYGVGKTSTLGKLAKYFQAKGMKVGLIAADSHRAAAIEQLRQISEQVKCEFYGKEGASAEENTSKGLWELERQKCDVIVLDTAGRSAFDQELAEELKKLNSVFAPDETFLVVSADVGQVAGRQATEFKKAVKLTGVIVTKMDGSGKGGGALSAVHASEAKVAFIGVGEKPEDLQEFDAQKFVARLCGFPDLPELMKKVKEVAGEEQLQKALEEGKLDYNSFMAQMKAMRKMGPLKGVFQMLGAYDLPEELVGKGEEKMRKFESIVNSMTPKERGEPELMKNAKRQERVARGAGVDLKEVRELVSNFEKINKMMKGMRGNRGLMKNLGKMMPGFGGMR